jgi:hypothetical protein
MKRKFTFFGICVLLCTLMISLGSCQKDYSDDIDDLQRQINENKTAVAALNQAIASGKLIKTVATVTGGYQITFSDNTTITINHGTTGATGATGPQGPAGTPGAPGAPGVDGFTPIVGIDADGYWTVITTQGGTPVRIKNANNEEVLAQYSKDLGTTATGMLTVGGVETTVYIPMIVYNEVTKQLTITLQNADKTFSSYTVPVSETTFLATDLVSVLSPIGETKAILGYGKVGATNASVNATPALATEGLTFAGVALNQQLRTGGVLPIILNPSGVNTDDYTFELIKQDGSLFKLQPSSITSGYDGAFAQYAAGTSNGLYTLHFTPTLADMQLVPGETKQLAVRAVKGDREVVSGYQYTVNVTPDITTLFAVKAGEIVTPPHTIYAPIGTTLNVLSRYDRTNVAPVRTLASTDFFKSAIANDPASINTDVQDFVTLSGTSVTTAQPSIETVSNLNDKKLSYFLKTFDWVGKYEKTPIDIIYYAELNTNVADIDLGTHTLSTTSTTKSAMLTPMFSALQAEGKTELWRSQATNVKVEIYKGSVAVANLLTPLAAGINYQFKDAADAAVNAANATITALAEVQDIRKVEFTINPAVALPGNYIMVLKFDDRRAYAQGVEFTVEMPLTVVNPTIAALATATEKKANLFDGQKLSVYGTAPAAPVQGLPANWYYVINEAYKNLSLAAAPAAPAIGVANWGFVYDPTPLVPSAMLTATNNGQFNFGSVLVANTTTARPYTEYPVKLYYYYFGNVNNKQLLETITVVARSEVKDGSSEVLVPAASTGLPATLQVTNGDLVTVRNFAPYFRVKDYLGVNLNVFGARDARIAGVAVTVPASQAHLIDIVPSGSDWNIKATNNVAVLPTAFVDIPVTLEITDLLDVKTTYTINVRVVKP